MGSDLFKLDLLGQSLTIRSKEDPAGTAQIVEYLNLKLQAIQRETRLTDPVRVSLLAALSVAQELFALKAAGFREPPEAREIEEITERLISRIERSLEEPLPGPGERPGG